MNLAELRKEIDALDRQLVVLLGRRLKIAKEIALIKKQKKLPILDPVREKEIKERLSKLALAEGLSASIIEELFTLLLDYTRFEMEAHS